jgi:hypothetical protein
MHEGERDGERVRERFGWYMIRFREEWVSENEWSERQTAAERAEL